jgi:outer membrane phospholipase A
MMWDALIAKPYFYDLNYNPELFYRWRLDGENTEWLDIGAEHESNGKGASGERAWDRAFLRYHVATQMNSEHKLHFEVKAWVPGDYDANNKDLPRYRGVWEINVTLSDCLRPWLERGDLTLRLYPGGPSFTDPTRGGQELTFTARLSSSSVLPVFVAQVFHGYAEELLDYNISHWSVRAGFGF